MCIYDSGRNTIIFLLFSKYSLGWWEISLHSYCEGSNCCLGVSFAPPRCAESSCLHTAVGARQLLSLSIPLYRASHPNCCHLHPDSSFCACFVIDWLSGVLVSKATTRKLPTTTLMSNAESGAERHFPWMLCEECARVFWCWEVGQGGTCLTYVTECLWKAPDWQVAGCTQHGGNVREAWVISPCPVKKNHQHNANQKYARWMWVFFFFFFDECGFVFVHS